MDKENTPNNFPPQTPQEKECMHGIAKLIKEAFDCEIELRQRSRPDKTIGIAATTNVVSLPENL